MSIFPEAAFYDRPAGSRRLTGSVGGDQYASMNPWQRVLRLLNAGDVLTPFDAGALTALLKWLDDRARRRMATELAGHLRRLPPHRLEAQAAVLRVAGAACLDTAEEVAAWLDRDELRRRSNGEEDTARILAVLAGRPAAWREDLAARLVLAYQDRAAVVRALDGWRRAKWGDPFDPHPYVWGISGHDSYPRALLARAGLALVMPDDSRRLSGLPTDAHGKNRHYDAAPQRLVQQRFRELIDLFESGATKPVLLATPTHATGHLDPETLLTRMARLGRADPLPTDPGRPCCDSPGTWTWRWPLRPRRSAPPPGTRWRSGCAGTGCPTPR